MKNTSLRKAFTALFLLVFLAFPANAVGAGNVTILPPLTRFVSGLINGQARMIRGVYVPGVLALMVEQQPEGEAGTVLGKDGIVTQFGAAARNNVIGLLAHNNLAGATFFNLRIGQEVMIVYGDGRIDHFVVNRLARFQALDPESQNSDFMDLSSDLIYSAEQIFSIFYDGATHVTFQTCIDQYGEASWGRLFVTAGKASHPFATGSLPFASSDNLKLIKN